MIRYILRRNCDSLVRLFRDIHEYAIAMAGFTGSSMKIYYGYTLTFQSGWTILRTGKRSIANSIKKAEMHITKGGKDFPFDKATRKVNSKLQ